MEREKTGNVGLELEVLDWTQCFTLYLSYRERNIDMCVCICTSGSNNTLIVKILAYKYHFTLGLIGEVGDSRTEVGRESLKEAQKL